MAPVSPADSLSPSLASPAGGNVPAYELKFLLADDRAAAAEAWAGRHLPLDPHALAAPGHAYEIHGLYLDTPALDVFHRRGPLRRQKFRLRRYGAEPWVYLERKRKKGDRVRKRRAVIPDAELPVLAEPEAAPEWPGHWFQRRLVLRGMRPVCQVSYLRTAFAGSGGDGPLRLTLDRGVRCAPASDWLPADAKGGLPLLGGQTILELKYRSTLPALFKQLIQEMGLSPGAVSKYRTGVRAWGLDAVQKGAG